MISFPTPLEGAYVLELERIEDDRGWFARSYSDDEFRTHGLDPTIRQCNVSFNAHAGTLRGMHYQVPPFAETKLVRCTRGAIYDVVIDLRPRSPTYKRWHAVELTEENGRLLYIPKGFAHGFATLTDAAEVFYQMSQVYSAEHARGVRWDDPAFGIEWPREPTTISARDRGYVDFTG